MKGRLMGMEVSEGRGMRCMGSRWYEDRDN